MQGISEGKKVTIQRGPENTMNRNILKYMTEFTSLSAKEKQEIIDALVLEEYELGSYLIKQGDVPSFKCYFILKGCIRQYYVDESGKEITTHFYTEEQAVLTFNSQETEQVSNYSLVCLEDCVLIVGSLDNEKNMYQKYSQLETMTRKMMEIYLREAKVELSELIQATPEERYKAILKKRHTLVNRVPQHQLASYLGITPESLSRIKKRMKSDIR